MLRIRTFHPDDSAPLRLIFHRAITQGAAGFYDAAQRAAWARAPEAPPDWTSRLGDQITVVAERPSGPVGFMTLGHDGHLDLAFVAPEVMGTGVASALHDRLIAHAETAGLHQLSTEASHLARRFFLRHGWRELAEQQVMINGVALTNFRMEKRLSTAP